MDSCDSDLPLDDHEVEDDWNEDDVGEAPVGSVPKELWYDTPPDKCPPEPEPWIESVADMVELGRLCGMQVLEEMEPPPKDGLEDRDWLLENFPCFNAKVIPTLLQLRLIPSTFCR